MSFPIREKGANPQTKGTLYFLRWMRIQTVTKPELAKIMARGSTSGVGEVDGVTADFGTDVLQETQKSSTFAA